MKGISKELIGAFAVPIILTILRNGDSYGYEIVQKVKHLTDGKITWQEASIYPVLKRLENSRMIKSYWKVEDSERPRKYYTILEDGKEQLGHNKVQWEMIYFLLDKLWNPAT